MSRRLPTIAEEDRARERAHKSEIDSLRADVARLIYEKGAIEVQLNERIAVLTNEAARLREHRDRLMHYGLAEDARELVEELTAQRDALRAVVEKVDTKTYILIEELISDGNDGEKLECALTTANAISAALEEADDG